VVDVRDDAEIPYEFWIHSFRLPAGAASMQDDTPSRSAKTVPCKHSVCHKSGGRAAAEESLHPAVDACNFGAYSLRDLCTLLDDGAC
jgi:hypothetical protein